MEIILAILGAGSAGGFLAYGSAANTKLMQLTRSPIAAATINFIMGFLTLAILLLLKVISPLSINQISQAPWWAFLGGALGAIFVTLNTIIIPKLGLTTTTMAIVFGQILMSLIVDQFGLLGVATRSISIPRLIGTGLLLAAVIMTQFNLKHEK
jgi:transporter family-2 protein